MFKHNSFFGKSRTIKSVYTFLFGRQYVISLDYRSRLLLHEHAFIPHQEEWEDELPPQEDDSDISRNYEDNYSGLIFMDADAVGYEEDIYDTEGGDDGAGDLLLNEIDSDYHLFPNYDKDEDVSGLIPHEEKTPYFFLFWPGVHFNTIFFVEDDELWSSEEDYDDEDQFAFVEDDEEEFDEETAYEDAHIDDNFLQEEDDAEQSEQGSMIQEMDENPELPYIEYPAHVRYNFILRFFLKYF